MTSIKGIVSSNAHKLFIKNTLNPNIEIEKFNADMFIRNRNCDYITNFNNLIDLTQEQRDNPKTPYYLAAIMYDLIGDHNPNLFTGEKCTQHANLTQENANKVENKLSEVIKPSISQN